MNLANLLDALGIIISSVRALAQLHVEVLASLRVELLRVLQGPLPHHILRFLTELVDLHLAPAYLFPSFAAHY